MMRRRMILPSQCDILVSRLGLGRGPKCHTLPAMKLQKMTKNKNKEPAKKVDVDDDAKQELTKKENDVEKDVDYDDDAKEEPAKKEL